MLHRLYHYPCQQVLIPTLRTGRTLSPLSLLRFPVSWMTMTTNLLLRRKGVSIYYWFHYFSIHKYSFNKVVHISATKHFSSPIKAMFQGSQIQSNSIHHALLHHCLKNCTTLWNIWTYQLLCKKNYTTCVKLISELFLELLSSDFFLFIIVTIAIM